MTKFVLLLITFLSFGFMAFAVQTEADDTIKVRQFDDDLSKKYSSDEFIYVDPEPIQKKTENYSWLDALGDFFGNAFPVIIILIAVFIIVRVLINREGFWVFGKSPDKAVKALDLVDEEEIENLDIDLLLSKALEDKNYRLAVRYYYLNTLKKLSAINLITIDKDKTNSDYLFEIKDLNSRKEFSKLSYIYDYVWYGEFKLDDVRFQQIQKAFNNFNSSIQS